MELVKTLVVLASLVAMTSAQPTLVASPVPGKLGFEPATNFAEAVIIPATSTAYLSGRVGGNSSDFGTQVRASLDSLNETMSALGSTMDAGVKTTVYLADLDYFQDMNAIYRTYFTTVLPSRSTIEASALAGGTMIEIEMIAVDPIFATMKASS